MRTRCAADRKIHLNARLLNAELRLDRSAMKMLIMLLQTALASLTSAAAADWPEFVELHTGEWFSLGNHRFNATVSANAVARTLPAGAPVRVRAQWRRSDTAPLEKAVFVRSGTHN